MQFEVSDEAAIALASGFYKALAVNYPVDAAVAEARKAVFAAGCGVEWGTPVLYLRAPDGRIFDVDVSSRDKPPQESEARQPASRREHFCIHCGQSVVQEDFFCTNCGKPARL
jgi:hypothetical protein